MLHGKAQQHLASEPSDSKDPQMPISEGAWWGVACVFVGLRRRGSEGGGGQLLCRARANAKMGLSGVIPFGLVSLWGGLGRGGS